MRFKRATVFDNPRGVLMARLNPRLFYLAVPPMDIEKCIEVHAVNPIEEREEAIPVSLPSLESQSIFSPLTFVFHDSESGKG